MARAAAGMVLLLSIGAHAGDCDTALAEKAYVKCAACHSLEQGRHLTGPSLYGIAGRQAGKVEGFLFSLALEQSAITWDAQALDEFLENPMTYVPGTTMPFGGLRDEHEREALVCWLSGL